MNSKLRFANLLLCAVSIFARELITKTPVKAATLALSEAELTINNFSQSPQEFNTLTDAITSTLSTNGSVTAEATATAEAYFSPTICR